MAVFDIFTAAIASKFALYQKGKWKVRTVYHWINKKIKKLKIKTLNTVNVHKWWGGIYVVSLAWIFIRAKQISKKPNQNIW